jgi:hypothetical protein
VVARVPKTADHSRAEYISITDTAGEFGRVKNW